MTAALRRALVAGLVWSLGPLAHAGSLTMGPLRFVVGGEASGTFGSHDPGYFDYTRGAYQPQRLFRLRLDGELRLGSRLAFLTEVRSDDLHAVKAHGAYIRLRPLDGKAFDLQVGRIPPVFGGFPRRYGDDNPLIGVPLPYQYLTTMRSDALPYGSDDLLRRRGWGARSRTGMYDARSLGLPLVEGTLWDTGIEAHVGSGALQAAAAITRGSPGHPVWRDDNGDKQISARVQWQPTAGLVSGLSYARGAYLEQAGIVPLGTSVNTTRQQVLGLDSEYARGHGILRLEVLRSAWDTPSVSTRAPLHAWGVLVEGRYTVAPGLFVAGRVERLGFEHLTGQTLADSWDADVWRFETGLGYALRRNLRLKGGYQHNWRNAGPRHSAGLFALQAALHF
jgi:hypothetical protein